MGRHSEDRDYHSSKKKKQKSSRDHSPSSIDSHSSRHKKSKKSKKSHHRSRSPSYERSYRRSRSRSKDRRSRSRSRDRYRRSRSGSRSRSYKRSRNSRSHSKGRHRRSRSKSYSRSRRSSRSRSKEKSGSRHTSPPKAQFDTSTIPGFSDMSASQKSEIRLQMAIKAAAAADRKITSQILGEDAMSFEDRQKLAVAKDDIDAEGFMPSNFVSSKSKPTTDNKSSSGHGDAIFGLLTSLPPLPMKMPEKISTDPRAIMHENLYTSSDVKMERWIEKLTKRKQLEDNR